MRTTASKSSFVFEVASIVDGSKVAVHAQVMTPHQASLPGKNALSESEQQTQHCDIKYNLIYSTCGKRKMRRKCEVSTEWLGLHENDDKTWEPLSKVKQDLSGVLEDFLRSVSERNLKREMLNIYFRISIFVQYSWSIVICRVLMTRLLLHDTQEPNEIFFQYADSLPAGHAYTSMVPYGIIITTWCLYFGPTHTAT